MNAKLKRYMLDTNTASYIIKAASDRIKAKLDAVPMASVCVSSISQAELLLGVAKKPQAKHLPLIVNEFLLRVEVLPWDTNAATVYAELRTASEKKGKSLGTMDMLIAAHSVAVGATLVTSDKAFYHLRDFLKLEDWTQ